MYNIEEALSIEQLITILQSVPDKTKKVGATYGSDTMPIKKLITEGYDGNQPDYIVLLLESP